MSGYPRLCVVFALFVCRSSAGQGQFEGPTSDGLEGLRGLVARLQQGERQGAADAVQALASDRWGGFGRLLIVQTIAKTHQEEAFARAVEDFFRVEMQAKLELAKWEREGADPKRGPARHLRVGAARWVLTACLMLRKIGRPVDLLRSGPAFFRPPSDPELAVLAAKVACTDPLSGGSACLEAVKVQVMNPAFRAPWSTEVSRIAIKVLAERAAGASADDHRSICGVLAWATTDKFPLLVRVDAMAALRTLLPNGAAEAATKMGKEERTEDDLEQLERLLVHAETAGVRCEALFLLSAAGKAVEVRGRLENRLRADGLPKAERANVDFALRLLSGGRPRRD